MCHYLNLFVDAFSMQSFFVKARIFIYFNKTRLIFIKDNHYKPFEKLKLFVKHQAIEDIKYKKLTINSQTYSV